MLPSIMYECKKCNKMTEGNVVPKGNQIGLYCSHCGSWIKWLPKDEYARRGEKQSTASSQPTINHNACVIYHCYEKKEDCFYADCYGNCTTDSCKKLEIREQQQKQSGLPNELTINGVIYVKKEK